MVIERARRAGALAALDIVCHGLDEVSMNPGRFDVATIIAARKSVETIIAAVKDGRVP